MVAFTKDQRQNELTGIQNLLGFGFLPHVIGYR